MCSHRPIGLPAFLFATVLAAQQPTATFIGNCAFRFDLDSIVLYSDFPYESGYSGYDTYDTTGFNYTGAETALITHAHRDHYDSTLFYASSMDLIAPWLPEEVNAHSIAEFGAVGIDVQMIPTKHAGIPHCSYLVEADSLRLYFTGDTEDTEDLLDIRDLDVAFVTPWLINAVNRMGRVIDAHTVVMYHHEAALYRGKRVTPPCNRCTFIIPRQGEVIPLIRRP